MSSFAVNHNLSLMKFPEYNLRPRSPEQTPFGVEAVERMVSILEQILEILGIAGWLEIYQEHMAN